MKYFKIIPNSQDCIWEHSPTLSLFCKWHLVWFLDIFLVSDCLQESSCSVFSEVEAIQRNKSLGHLGIWTSHSNVQLLQQFHLCLLVWLKTVTPEWGERGAVPWSPLLRWSPRWHQGPAKPTLRFMAGSSLSQAASGPAACTQCLCSSWGQKGRIWGEEI